MTDFHPPRPCPVFDHLFTTPAQRKVQTPAQSHEYKKTSGSSDAAHTYDTNRI